MDINRINTCTFCEKPFKGFKLNLSMKVQASREKENGVWEIVENSDVISNEILCKECFEIFANTLTEVMEEST